MKIGIDIRTLMDARYSGVSEYTFNIVREILKLDTKNTYKLFLNSGRDVSERIPAFREANAELVYTRYPNKVFNYLMQKTLNRPKIDQLLGVDLFFMPHINFAALSRDTRKIITIHDLSFLRNQNYFYWRKNIWHYALNIKRLLKQIDHIIAVSKSTKSDLIDFFKIEEKKISVIHSGLDKCFRVMDEIKEQNTVRKIKNKYGLPLKFILGLSTIEPRKNIEGIIKAYEIIRQDERNKDIKLVIAGGEGWKYRSILKTAKMSKFHKDILFVGYVEAQDKVYLYNLAEVFVYPSFYEGFGFPPLEAMASGCPVVTSGISSLPEVTGDAALLVNPHNINEIGQAMDLVLNNTRVADTYRERGLRQSERFRWEKSAKETLKIFNIFT